jgi:hypothetical protein
MLKAIWPSIHARVPNHLPAGANITTLGQERCLSSRPRLIVFDRRHVLSFILAHSIPPDACVTSEDTMAVLGKDYHRSAMLVRDAYLGFYQSSRLRRSF